MKVILTYGNYFDQGKKYQIKFQYENEQEIENIKDLMDRLKDTKSFDYYYLDQNGNIVLTETSIYGGTNIPEEYLHPFISTLLYIKNTTVIIGTKEFTDYNPDTINEAIDSLHINATLSKGIYFSGKPTYYIIFKYASTEQQEEMHQILTSLTESKKEEQLMPFLIDQTGDLTNKDASIIGGTNIPETLLKDYIRIFIEKYNIIIIIGSKKFKDKLDDKELEEALSDIEPGRSKTLYKATI